MRLSTSLADRLRRAHYLTKRSQTDIINDALEHWLANPRKPGCGVRSAVAPYIAPADLAMLEREGG